MKWKSVLAGGLLSLVLFSGCSVRSADELYALPRQSDTYYDLQDAIDRVLKAGAAYSGPITGSNQQAVQLSDLDGDGLEEALVFVKIGAEKPLKIYIFDRVDGTYKNIAVLEGEGSTFDSVEYAQLDGEPGLEIIVGRQLSDQILQSLSVYSFSGGSPAELMSANYSEFQVVDLDADDKKDVFLLRMETEERNGVAELYRYRGGLMERDHEASLSTGAKQIRRIISGNAAPGVPAVFVASSYETDTIITDIFALVGGDLINVASDLEAGVSAQTVRNYNVYAEDIDEDGVIELPMPIALPSAQAGEETFWTIDWYNLKPDGQRQVKMTTFHNYSGSWYLILPEHWYGQITVSREKDSSGAIGYTFSKWKDYETSPEKILTIHSFTGEDRLTLARQDGFTLLAEKGDTAYAASLGTCSWARQLTKEDLNAMFRFIYYDWNTGER